MTSLGDLAYEAGYEDGYREGIDYVLRFVISFCQTPRERGPTSEARQGISDNVKE